MKQNSFASPDFAFPKTVGENASAELKKALSSGNYLEALKAAIQLDVASDLVSSGNYPESIARFDSIAHLAASPASNLALLLEAAVYKDIYSSHPYVFSQRKLPASPMPENVLEWDKSMFVNKVSELVKRAFVNSSALAGMPISEISQVIVNYQDASKEGFSVLDFMTIQAQNLLAPFSNAIEIGRIPFGDGSGVIKDAGDSLLSSLLDDAIARHKDDSDKFALAYFMKEKLGMLPSNEREDYLKQCYNLFRFTPYGADFVTQYCNSLPAGNIRERYEILTSYRSAFPDARNIVVVDNMINSLLSRSVSVTAVSQLLPDRENKVNVNGANIYDFYLLAFKLPYRNNDSGYRYSDIPAGAKPSAAVSVKIDKTSPENFDTTVMLPALEPGMYALVASSAPNASGILQNDRKAYLSTTLVSNISAFSVSAEKSTDRLLYVVSALNQKPLPGSIVRLYKRTNGTIRLEKTLTTSEDGSTVVPNGQYFYEAEYKGNFVSGSLYNVYERNNNRVVLNGSILTDLSIYRPGDTIEFSAVAYSSDQATHSLKAASGKRLKMVLRDANSQQVDTLQLNTDEFGRCCGRFTIPNSGLLGNWNLELRENDRYVASRWIEVAEYKAPTFYAVVDASSDEFKVGDDLKFTGKAMTYSGMPVAGAKVAYTVDYQPVWWRMNGSDASYGGDAVTAADGSFSVNLPTRGLENTRFATGSYSLHVSVTDAAGETREAPALRFSLGKAFRIQPSIPQTLKVKGDKCNLEVAVYDMGNHPVQKKIYYQVCADGKTLQEGSFDSPSLMLDTRSLPSGKYMLRFSLNPDFPDKGGETPTVESSVTLWRENDKVPPVKTPLWMPESMVNLPKNAREVKMRVGSSYDDSFILMQVSNSNRLVSREWIKVSNGFANVKLDAPADNERLFVTLLGEHDLECADMTVTVVPYTQRQNLEIEKITFRDRLDSGSSEKWQFRFMLDGKECDQIPVMAVMSNKALNDIAPFSWQFKPSSSLYWQKAAQLVYTNPYSVSNYYYGRPSNSDKHYSSFITPDWNTYGYSLYGGLNGGQIRLRSGATLSSGVRNMNKVMAQSEAGYDSDGEVATESVVMESYSAAPKMAMAIMADAADEDMPESESAAVKTDGNSSEDSLRDIRCPLAFFQPGLTTDANGVATVDFTLPAFVGTWQFQILGYTPAMKSAMLILDAVATKRVMTQLNAPRFVRTSDKVSVAATLFNNSDSAAPVSGKIEIIDPLTGEVVAVREFSPEEVAPSGSRVVSLEFQVPSEVNSLAIRAYAYAPGYSDGEQSVIPVLPSSAPVIESEPFYIAPGSDTFALALSKMNPEACVTLSYCDNPVWECVTALPGMLRPESVNILAQARALYGNCIASGLFAKYPELLEGIRRMASPANAADSSLYSPLAKNESLKTVLLNNTPWVNDAASETARMQSLVEYGDPSKVKAAVDDALKTLADRQNSDGGWSWCPGMKSSIFITGHVLNTLASLADMGYLPEEARTLAKKACGYLDNEYAREWNASKRKYIPVAQLLNYLYDKSCLMDATTTSRIKPVEQAALSEIRKEWRNFTIADKATAAMLFSRHGDKRKSGDTSLARNILESLTQFASVSADKGMWFENLRSGSWNDKALLSTARVLQAYAMIDPANPAVNKLRQWMVISKQTSKWGDNSETAAAINALLSSGSEWTANSEAPQVYLNGSPVSVPASADVTGTFTVNLDAANASGGKLEIRRTASGPAWGGVISQFVAPIAGVHAQSVPQLSIVKNVYAVSTEGQETVAASGNLKVGDLVRVTLTIICDRDLEYVAVTDPRSACLESVDQLSGYTSSDGIWFYREVRDAQTNLFIPFLPKGTHVISYECNIDRTGSYSLGVANAQSQYSPEITAHSAGAVMTVR